MIWYTRSFHLLACLGLMVATGCSCGSRNETIDPPKLKTYDGGFFSIDIPKGWNMHVSGQCSTLAFLARDSEEPLRQIFSFGQVGPVYISEQQRMIDIQYMQSGGYPITYVQMPVVYPATPERFLEQFQMIAQTGIARQFMPECPVLQNLQIVSSQPLPCPISGGGRTALIRAVFQRNGRVAEGLFTVTLAPGTPFMGGPGGGTLQAFLFSGITAPREEFADLEETLSRALGSYYIDEAYVENCMAQMHETYNGIVKAGNTLRETSNMIMDSWQDRNRSDDILAARRSDTILDKERLYDPSSGKVYEFDNGFYDRYRIQPEKYRNPDLKPLPNDNYDLWTAPTRDGYRHLNLD